MSQQMSNKTITYRATLSSYIALSGIWILLAVGYLFLSIRSPGKGLELGAILAGGVTLIWWIWLSGFKITVSDGCLRYRDGFFRYSKVFLKDVADVKSKNIEWGMFTRKVKIPRIVIFKQNGEVALLINPKPFGRINLQKILSNAKSECS